MRYRLVPFLLFSALPLMHALAAPAPDHAYAILDIGPPPKGCTLGEHSTTEIGHLTFPYGILSMVWSDPEVRKLPSVAPMKDPRPWLAKNLRIGELVGGRRLRLTFRDGNRDEQVTILNAVLRVKLRLEQDSIKGQEEILLWDENRILELEQRIASGQHHESVDSYTKGINDLRCNRIPACRAEIVRLKQIAVIKWAK